MRFRPRFTVRTLAIVVTLVCAYFGAWELTQRCGSEPPHSRTVYIESQEKPIILWESPEYSPAAFIIRRQEWDYISLDMATEKYCYYLWLFGVRYKLPFQSKWHDLWIHSPAPRRENAPEFQNSHYSPGLQNQSLPACRVTMSACHMAKKWPNGGDSGSSAGLACCY